MSQQSHTDPQIHYQKQTAQGRERFEILVGGRSVSQVEIERLMIRVGCATMRVDGIVGVETDPAYRMRGFLRRLMAVTIQHMQQGDACLSVLHGIDNLYQKFGYVVLGPMYHLYPDREQPTELPAGWSTRPFKIDDLPAIQQIYDRQTSKIVGAQLRPPSASIWQRLAQVALSDSNDVCRVVEDQYGRVVAYAWQGKGLNYVALFEGYDPNALILGEVIADSPRSADALLAVCRMWGQEEAIRRGKNISKIYISLPPDMHVVTAALYQESWFNTQTFRNGGPMVRLLSTQRLLQSLTSELWQRGQQANYMFRGIVCLQTEMGSGLLQMTPEGITVVAAANASESTTLTIQLPHTVLARLALGGFLPDDLLQRSLPELSQQARELLTVLFPQRYPHFFMVDRP